MARKTRLVRSVNPAILGGPDNLELLIKELGDVAAAVDIADLNEVPLPVDAIAIAADRKRTKVEQYLHHAKVPR